MCAGAVDRPHLLGKRRPIFNKIQKTAQGGPTGAPRRPMGPQRMAKGGPRHPKGSQRAAQGCPQVTQDGQRGPKGRPNGPKAPQREPKGTQSRPEGSQKDPKSAHYINNSRSTAPGGHYVISSTSPNILHIYFMHMLLHIYSLPSVGVSPLLYLPVCSPGAETPVTAPVTSTKLSTALSGCYVSYN